MTSRRKPPIPTNPSHDLRQRILEYFQTLRIPMSADELDAALAEAEKQRWGPLELLSHLLGPQADLRRQRAIDRRIREARFREPTTLEGFDWAFNAQAIDRMQIETLATGEFIRRGDNLVIAGQSGVGKSRIVQSVGRAACAQGYRVRYTTSAELLRDLTASLADHSLHERLRYYSNFDLLAIDEFGFDRIERAESGQAASLLYKVVDSRGPKRSTAMVTNISFEAWADYLGDAPLAMAILDRLVDGAIVLKIEGRSYRAHRAKQPAAPAVAEMPNRNGRGRPRVDYPILFSARSRLPDSPVMPAIDLRHAAIAGLDRAGLDALGLRPQSPQRPLAPRPLPCPPIRPLPKPRLLGRSGDESLPLLQVPFRRTPTRPLGGGPSPLRPCRSRRPLPAPRYRRPLAHILSIPTDLPIGTLLAQFRPPHRLNPRPPPTHGGLSLSEVVVPAFRLERVTEKFAAVELTGSAVVIAVEEDQETEVSFAVRNKGNVDAEFEVIVRTNLGEQVLTHSGTSVAGRDGAVEVLSTGYYRLRPTGEVTVRAR